jgi:hypothetical protein
VAVDTLLGGLRERDNWSLVTVSVLLVLIAKTGDVDGIVWQVKRRKEAVRHTEGVCSGFTFQE